MESAGPSKGDELPEAGLMIPTSPWWGFFMGESFQKFFVISLGAVLGANSRYWISGLGQKWFGPTFPYGTLLVNLTGCFGIGLLMTLFLEHFSMTPLSRLFVVVGILGGYTTFSAFGWETYSMVGGLAAVWVGVVLGRIL